MMIRVNNFERQIQPIELVGADSCKFNGEVGRLFTINKTILDSLSTLLTHNYSGNQEVVSCMESEYLLMTNTIVSLLHDELMSDNKQHPEGEVYELLRILLVVYPSTFYGCCFQDTATFYQNATYRHEMGIGFINSPKSEGEYTNYIHKLLVLVPKLIPSIGLIDWDVRTLAKMASSFNSFIRTRHSNRSSFELTGYLPTVNPEACVYKVRVLRKFLEPLVDMIDPRPLLDRLNDNVIIYCSELDYQLLALYTYSGNMYVSHDMGVGNLNAPGVKEITDETFKLMSEVELNPISKVHLYGKPYKPFSKEVSKVIIKQFPQFFSEVYHD